MTQFQNKSFSVAVGGDADYRERWEATFGTRRERDQSNDESRQAGSSDKEVPVGKLARMALAQNNARRGIGGQMLTAFTCALCEREDTAGSTATPLFCGECVVALRAAELDSPNFVPQAAKDLEARGFQRINRATPTPSVTDSDALRAAEFLNGWRGGGGLGNMNLDMAAKELASIFAAIRGEAAPSSGKEKAPGEPGAFCRKCGHYVDCDACTFDSY